MFPLYIINFHCSITTTLSLTLSKNMYVVTIIWTVLVRLQMPNPRLFMVYTISLLPSLNGLFAWNSTIIVTGLGQNLSLVWLYQMYHEITYLRAFCNFAVIDFNFRKWCPNFTKIPEQMWNPIWNCRQIQTPFDENMTKSKSFTANIVHVVKYVISCASHVCNACACNTLCCHFITDNYIRCHVTICRLMYLLTFNTTKQNMFC